MVYNKTSVVIISLIYLVASTLFAEPIYYGSYKVGPEDVLSIIQKDKEYRLLVTQNGDINIPGVGNVDVINKTIRQIQSEIVIIQRSPDYMGIGDPITVNLWTKSTKDVALIGAFNNPASMSANRLSILVANAGDLGSTASGVVYVYYPDKNEPIKYKVSRFAKGKKSPETDPWVPRGAIVAAKRSFIKSIFYGKTVNIVYTALASAVLIVTLQNNQGN